MKKKLIAVVCLVCLSIPVVASAGTTGDSKKIDDYHQITGQLSTASGSASAGTAFEGIRGHNPCNDGLYVYAEAVDKNGNKLTGKENYNWNAGINLTTADTSVYH
ncbi:hypothetical protein, partial [Clostridium perfringens]|uniref:hypothetical protein n=2 Tax=Clostridium TaxID=1485 RepID=UPI002AC73524